MMDDDKTTDQLHAELSTLQTEQKRIKARKKAIGRVLDARALEERVRALAEGLSDAERAALAQVIGGAGAIASEEDVGKPGMSG